MQASSATIQVLDRLGRRQIGQSGRYAPGVLSAFLGLIALGLPVLIGIAWLRGRKGSSGAAGALAEVSEMLNPSQPSAEILAAMREGEQDEESDDDPDPRD